MTTTHSGLPAPDAARTALCAEGATSGADAPDVAPVGELSAVLS